MAAADERDDETVGPGTDPNTGNFAKQSSELASSTARPRRGRDAPNSDTLLSAPAPATHDELMSEERLANIERQIEAVAERVTTLEREPRGAPTGPRLASWYWLVFLAGLALAWQILRYLR